MISKKITELRSSFLDWLSFSSLLNLFSKLLISSSADSMICALVELAVMLDVVILICDECVLSK